MNRKTLCKTMSAGYSLCSTMASEAANEAPPVSMRRSHPIGSMAVFMGKKSIARCIPGAQTPGVAKLLLLGQPLRSCCS